MIDTAGLREAGDRTTPGHIASEANRPDVTTTLSVPHKVHAILAGVATEHGCAPEDVYRLAILGWLESHDVRGLLAPCGDEAVMLGRDPLRRLRYGIDPRTGDRSLANQYWDGVRSEAGLMLDASEERRRNLTDQAAATPNAGEIFDRLRRGGRI